MAFKAATPLQLVLLISWTVLSDTPASQKHKYFVRFITSQAILEEIASTTSLVFAPGLFDVLQAAAPPTIKYFKTLPTEITKRWAVYLLVLEKLECRPKIYIGSGTEGRRGVQDRFTHYNSGLVLPPWVERALHDGYRITHKGLLAWNDLPTPALQPMLRLLFLALEAAFSYMLWAMRTVTTKDYGMAHICLWDRDTLEYDGLCSHCCLNEGIPGDFELSAEELEVLAVEKNEKRKADQKEISSNWHFKQVAENYDEYREGKNENKRKWIATQDPAELREKANAHAAKHMKIHTYYCQLCKVALGESHALKRYNESQGHLRKAEDLAKKAHVCTLCSWASDKLGHYNEHLQSKRHVKMAAAATAAPSSFQLD
jgi:hypothetical protein